ncbi:MAG: hypothetical protein IPP48_08115 [Chitinophagaceae bacterium]|nr:hypothetical protein [Chitinophagaceae bacterium]
MKVLKIILPLLVTLLAFVSCEQNADAPAPLQGTVKVTFSNKVKGTNLVLNTGSYINNTGETYSVKKFKYYISNVSVTNIDKAATEVESYHLIDQSNAASLSFSFTANAETYSHLNFIIGVDSLRNVSGAQTGALDPLNDMFWTWNSGYIMAKLEGTSPASAQVNNKIEYHIGGFSGPNNVLKKINITLPITAQMLNIRANKTSEIFIDADVDKWFSNNISFATEPVCTTPGALAKKIADNYMNMFTVTNVVNN